MRAQTARRTVLDWCAIAAVGTVLAFFIGMAVYGLLTGFTPSLRYADANFWVALGCAALAGLCGLYLIAELSGWRKVRLLPLLVLCAAAGYYAAITGVPSAATQWLGETSTVDFAVTRRDVSWGRNCTFRLAARNPDYAEYRTCADGLVPQPQVGDVLRVSGYRSDWGLSNEAVLVVSGNR